MFQPMLRFYRLSPLWGLALPLIGVLYAVFTLEFGDPALARQGRHVEGPGPGDARAGMSDSLSERRDFNPARAITTRIFPSPRS